ncbi:ABC transporter permease [Segeticoccus rhizosphaerae]|uniref:ABC transporter permease n=1 Tax=Segeticoccus rhizosphaerae TaxID=1104777 RepID=UPI00192E590C|nr:MULTISPECIES: ABC transporter permease [Intrasporangiaceae]
MRGLSTYLMGRLVAAVITLLGVSFVLVALIQFLPGDPARVIAGLRATPEQVARIRQQMGLDESVPVQFWRFLEHLFHGNMGTSARTGDSVVSEITARLPFTLELAILGTLVGVVAGITLGVIAATHKDRLLDSFVSMVGVMGISMPVYWLGILLIMLFSVKLQMLPVSGAATLSSLVLPSVTLGVFSMAIIARMTRSTMIDELGQDYVRTVRAKGVVERVVVYRHALRNAFVPILTVIGLQFGTLLGGAVLTETVFAWPGIGRLLVDSISARDYPMVQGIVFVFAAMFIVVNIITDLLYTVVDPRVRLYG